MSKRESPGVKAGRAFPKLDDGSAPPPRVVDAFERIVSHYEHARTAWPERYGIPFPTTIEEWRDLAYRAGVPEWQGHEIEDRTLRELEPRIEGYLERLRDQRVGQVFHDPNESDRTQTRKLTPTEQQYSDAICRAGHRLTMPEILSAVEDHTGTAASEHTAKTYLAKMVKDGILDHSDADNPPGYGIVESR